MRTIERVLISTFCYLLGYHLSINYLPSGWSFTLGYLCCFIVIVLYILLDKLYSKQSS